MFGSKHLRKEGAAISESRSGKENRSVPPGGGDNKISPEGDDGNSSPKVELSSTEKGQTAAEKTVLASSINASTSKEMGVGEESVGGVSEPGMRGPEGESQNGKGNGGLEGQPPTFSPSPLSAESLQASSSVLAEENRDSDFDGLLTSYVEGPFGEAGGSIIMPLGALRFLR